MKRPYGVFKNSKKKRKVWSWKQNRVKYLEFESARNLCDKNKIEGSISYNELRKTNPKLPSNPRSAYHFDWKGWKHFCKIVILPINEAKIVVKHLKIKSRREYYEYKSRKGSLRQLPGDPSCAYKKEWKGWNDFLGTKQTYDRKAKIVSFKQAKKIVRPMKLKSSTAFRKEVKINPILKNVPTYPEEAYSNRRRRNA